MKTLATLTIALLLSAAGTAQALAEKRVALVIGNSQYENTVYLENPRNDAISLSEMLRGLGFEVIERTDLRHTDMQSTLLEYSNRLRGADIGLFFYAGHGLQVDDRNYLVPVDAELSSEVDLAFETTELDVVMRILQRQTRTGLVFLDACRNNPLAGNLTRSMGSTRSASVGNGLARVDSGVGMLITFATQPGNVALDGFGNHSPFAEALLEFIDTPGIDVAQMLRRVRDKVIKTTNGKQVPWNNSSLTEDFYFRPEVKEEPQIAALPPAPTQTTEASVARAPANPGNVAIELAFWQSIVNSSDPAVFEAYLEQFPSGSFSSLARLRLRTLQSQAAVQQPSQKQKTVVATATPVVAAPVVTAAPVVEAPKFIEPPKQVEAVAVVPPQPEPQEQPRANEQLAALPPAKTLEPDYRVRRLDELQFALKISNVRAGPGTSYDTVDRLSIDQEIRVTGKVEGRNWYQIALSQGREGFIFGSLLTPDSPAAKAAAPAPKQVEVPQQQAAVAEKTTAEPAQKSSGPSAQELELLEEQKYWDGLRNSRNPSDYDGYLLRYGEYGLYSQEARRRSASLRTKQTTQTAETTTASGSTSTQGTTPAARSDAQSTTAPSEATAEQTAELTPPTNALPSAQYDGTWQGDAVTRFGTQCKSAYKMEFKIANARIGGTMIRSSERFSLSGEVDKLGNIENFDGMDRIRVVFKVSSATTDEIRGTWDMAAKSYFGGEPCRGKFSVTRAGS